MNSSKPDQPAIPKDAGDLSYMGIAVRDDDDDVCRSTGTGEGTVSCFGLGLGLVVEEVKEARGLGTGT